MREGPAALSPLIGLDCSPRISCRCSFGLIVARVIMMPPGVPPSKVRNTRLPSAHSEPYTSTPLSSSAAHASARPALDNRMSRPTTMRLRAKPCAQPRRNRATSAFNSLESGRVIVRLKQVIVSVLSLDAVVVFEAHDVAFRPIRPLLHFHDCAGEACPGFSIRCVAPWGCRSILFATARTRVVAGNARRALHHDSSARRDGGASAATAPSPGLTRQALDLKAARRCRCCLAAPGLKPRGGKDASLRPDF